MNINFLSRPLWPGVRYIHEGAGALVHLSPHISHKAALRRHYSRSYTRQELISFTLRPFYSSGDTDTHCMLRKFLNNAVNECFKDAGAYLCQRTLCNHSTARDNARLLYHFSGRCKVLIREYIVALTWRVSAIWRHATVLTNLENVLTC